MLPCLSKKFFGVDCLGCGMQRSIVFLLKGEFVAAFQMYPAIYPLLLLLIYLGTSFFITFKYDQLIKVVLMITIALTILSNYVTKIIF